MSFGGGSGSSSVAGSTDVVLNSPANNQVLGYNSGLAKWQNQATSRTYLFSADGNQSITTGQHRVYNDTGQTLTISSIRASVGTAPTGTALLVDVLKNGSTIFTTRANRPTVAAGGFTALSGTPDVTAWGVGAYLTVDVNQVGSTVPGADLTVQVVAS
jgi:hypothetical protein